VGDSVPASFVGLDVTGFVKGDSVGPTAGASVVGVKVPTTGAFDVFGVGNTIGLSVDAATGSALVDVAVGPSVGGEEGDLISDVSNVGEAVPVAGLRDGGG